SAKVSRVRTDELLSQSYADSPSQRETHYPQHSKQYSQSRHHDLLEIREHSDDDELQSDLDEMINNVPSDEELDPTMSPAPMQATPFMKQKNTNESMAPRN